MFSKFSAWNVVASTCALVAFPCFAQGLDAKIEGVKQKREARGVMLEEVVVTAQKREQSASDVPIAINAFTGDDLAELGLQDTQSISRMVPGFSANENGGQSTIFTLRGVGFNDTTYTATGTVGVYVDEVSLPYSSMTRGPSLDIARVEVLKGPQGTLYGRNTTGGLINFIPKGPTDELEAGFTAGYGRFDTVDVEGFVSGRLSENLGARLAAHVIDAGEGWQYSNTRPDETMGRQSKGSYRGILEWDATDSLFIKATIEGWEITGQPQAAQATSIQAQNPFVGDVALDPRVSNYPYYKGDDPRVADWDPEFDWQVNDSFMMGALKANWNITDTMEFAVIGSHLLVKADGSTSATSGLNVLNTDSVLDAEVKTDALELRLTDSFNDDKFIWMVGANVSKDVGEETRRIFIPTLSIFFPLPVDLPLLPDNLLGTMIDLNGAPTITQKAIFVNTDTILTDTISLNMGIRYTENKQEYTSCASEPEEAPPSAFGTLFTGLSALAALEYTLQTGQLGSPSVVSRGDCFILQEDGRNAQFEDVLLEDNVSGRIALSWTPDDESLYFMSLSRGFKAGGYPVLNASSTKQLVPATQEELVDFEVGSKNAFLDKRIQLDLGAFYYKYTDKQLLTRLLDPLFGPLPVLKNAPDSEVYGVEAAIQSNPFGGLFLSLAGSYVKTEINEFLSTNFTGDEEDFAGKPFNFSPEVQVSAVIDYTWALTETLDIGLGGDVSYSSETNGTLEQNSAYDIDSYTVLGARVHLGTVDDTWKVSLWGRNLTDELINTGSFNLGDSVVRYTGMTKTYGLSVSYLYR